jgi:hypothetical protein
LAAITPGGCSAEAAIQAGRLPAGQADRSHDPVLQRMGSVAAGQLGEVAR